MLKTIPSKSTKGTTKSCKIHYCICIEFGLNDIFYTCNVLVSRVYDIITTATNLCSLFHNRQHRFKGIWLLISLHEYFAFVSPHKYLPVLYPVWYKKGDKEKKWFKSVWWFKAGIIILKTILSKSRKSKRQDWKTRLFIFINRLFEGDILTL